jgi:hypothetical protein
VIKKREIQLLEGPQRPSYLNLTSVRKNLVYLPPYAIHVLAVDNL